MTATTIIREAQADGVMLAMSSTGTIKATGDGGAVNRWLAIIREHKAEIREALKVGAGDTATASYRWLIHYPDTFPDDRRRCSQCLNLRGRVCTVAAPGALVSANRRYKPRKNIPIRSAGYVPTADDPDQRVCTIRWLGLGWAE